MTRKIHQLENRIVHYQTNLDHEGVWLFLGTLGCWGVPNNWLRATAFLLTAGFFFWRAKMGKKEPLSFPAQIANLRKQIANETKNPNKVEKSNTELNEIVARYLSIRSLFRNPVFILCYCFWFASFILDIKEWSDILSKPH
jgi:hypothetical protein